MPKGQSAKSKPVSTNHPKRSSLSFGKIIRQVIEAERFQLPPYADSRFCIHGILSVSMIPVGDIG